MSALRQAVLGVLAAILSSAILIGSILLALAENGHQLARAIPPTPLPPVSTPRPGEPTFTASPTLEPTATPTLQAALECPPKQGWVQIEALPGETMASIAQTYGISVEELRQANCDYVGNIFPSAVILNVPASPITPTATLTAMPTTEPTQPPHSARASAVSPPVSCVHPISWIEYIVQRGDTLYRIATTRGITVTELMSANCLVSDTIRVGQRLWVPNVATRTPVPSATQYPINTSPPPTVGSTFPPTNVPTFTPTPTATATITTAPPPTATHTATITPTSNASDHSLSAIYPP